jgi:hypothetical protein
MVFARDVEWMRESAWQLMQADAGVMCGSALGFVALAWIAAALAARMRPLP